MLSNVITVEVHSDYGFGLIERGIQDLCRAEMIFEQVFNKLQLGGEVGNVATKVS